MLPGWRFLAMLVLLPAGIVIGQGDFKSLKNTQPSNFIIGSSDCKFQGQRKDCQNKYTKIAGLCPFDQVIGQLISSLDLKRITRDFVVPEKFYVEEFAFDTCSGKNDIQFKLKTKESYEIASRYLVLAAESTFVIAWKHTETEVTIEKLKISVDGMTSVGNDVNVRFELSKPLQRSDADLKMNMASVSLRDFLGKFNVDADNFQEMSGSGARSPVFSDGMNLEKTKLSISSWVFQQPEIVGIFAPGQGFEMVAKGKISAPILLTEASSIYVIVQDFKKADATAPKEEFDSPGAAIFIDYSQKSISSTLLKLTGAAVPSNLETIQGHRDFCITVATRSFTFVNNPVVRNLIEKFEPKKGIDVIDEGLHLMHFTQNTNDNVKDEEGKTLKKLLFRVEVSSNAVTWIPPQRIETTIKELAALAFTEKGLEHLPIAGSKKCVYDTITFLKDVKSINVNLNLTEPLSVVTGGLVTLLNCTLQLISRVDESGKYTDWELAGFGKEIVLEEQMDITIREDKSGDQGMRTLLSAESDIFSMTEIRERMKQKYLPKAYEKKFNLSNNFAVMELRYEVVFQNPSILRLKGKADFGFEEDNKPIVEIINFYEDGQSNPGLKVGLFWQDAQFHQIVNALFENDTLQSTWIKFSSTAIVFKRMPSSSFAFENELMKVADESAPHIPTIPSVATGNIAKGKSTKQSSTSSQGISSRAVDGNLNAMWEGQSCTHTEKEKNAWWRVDLQSESSVRMIRITNRGDCCSARLSNFDIYVGNTDDRPKENQLCVHHSGAVGSGVTVSLECAGEKKGRFVFIMLQGTESLTLCEVEVFSKTVKEIDQFGNLAKGKNAKQSSVSSNGDASKAVDGNLNTDYNDGKSCTQTNNEQNAWWRVDLGATIQVALVKITNRGDCCSERLSNFDVRVGDVDNDPNANALCVHLPEAVKGGVTIKLECDSPLEGRYVYVMLRGQNTLTLCEVEVFSQSEIDQALNGNFGNLAKGKATRQSSQDNGRRAVDGNLNTNFEGGSCTHTNKENKPWWMVDLGEETPVRLLKVTNRGDAVPERLRDFEIRVGNVEGDPEQNYLCMHHSGGVGKGATMELECKRQMFGRYVYVMLKGNDHLTMCEVEVYAGKPNEQGFQSGIGIAAENLDLSVCGMGNNEDGFCAFLKTRFGDSLPIQVKGRMYQTNMFVQSKLQIVKLDSNNQAHLRDVLFKIHTSEEGDQLLLEGSLVLSGKNEVFEKATIKAEGSNDIILKVFDKKSSGNIFKLNYIIMKPIRILQRMPVGYLETLEFYSTLYIGLSEEHMIKFPGGEKSRQYIGLKDTEENHLYIRADGLPLEKLIAAFGVRRVPETLLKGSRFIDNYIVAYNSKEDKEWTVPEGDIKISQGLYFIGKLSLASGGSRDARCEVTDYERVLCKMQLAPMKYGPRDSDDKIIRTTLSLYASEGQTDVGPTLTVVISNAGGIQRIQGYLETIGIQGLFAMTSIFRSPTDIEWTIWMQGNFYQEVPNTMLRLVARGYGLPTNMDIKLKMDITEQAAERASTGTKDALKRVQKDASNGIKKAQSKYEAATKLYAKYDDEIASKKSEMLGFKSEIEANNADIDQSVFEINEDCVTVSSTVPMGGLEWKDDCIATSGGKYMKCVTWNEGKDRVINVIELLKCEAKKLKASSNAQLKLEDNRLLLNRYKEAKTISKNLVKLKSVLKEAKDLAADAEGMIKEKTNFEDTIRGMLAKANEKDLVTINALRIDKSINKLNPPCLDFDIDFVLNTSPPMAHSGNYPICFNGEFFTNVGVQILRSSFSEVDQMYKALEDAELRYIRIEDIKKNADRASTKMRTDRKIDDDAKTARSKIGKKSPTVYDAIESELLQMAERRMPRFTTKSDKTIMGFHHYSPWAVARRSQSLAAAKPSDSRIKYKPSSKSGSPCHQARHVVSEYRDIAAGLRQVVENYNHGKTSFNLKKKMIHEDLEQSLDNLNKISNESKLAPSEIKDMFYWYHFTKEGMNQWMHHTSQQIHKHNVEGISFWRSEMNNYYGSPEVIGYLHNVASNSYSRSNIDRTHMRTAAKSLSQIRKTLLSLLGDSAISVEDASSDVQKMHREIETLHKSAVSCF